MTKYYATSVPGLESVVRADIRAKLEGSQLIEEKRGRLLFAYPGEPEQLLYLRSAEDVFVFVENIGGLTRSRNSLGAIFRRIRGANLETALRIHKQVHGGKGKKGLTFKVISNMVGRHNFRRVDVQTAVESSLVEKCGWRINLESPTLEFRIDLEEDTALFGLRLTDEKARKETYKMAHIPASLNPRVAYCMVLLSEPEPGDVFVDPMCGAGTIAIERALAGKYRRVIGGDIEEAVIRSARNNVNASRRSMDLMLWDVSNIPLQDHTVDKIVCNLPFGKQVGSRSENQSLYYAFFREMTRVLKHRGKAVLLTTESELMRELISRYPSVNLKRSLRIDLMGLRAYIYVMNIS